MIGKGKLKKMLHDNFVFGNQYRNAHIAKIEQGESISSKILIWLKNPKYIFYFCGNVGTGKTYLAASWYNHLLEEKKNVRAFTEQSLFSKLRGVISQDWDPSTEMANICEADHLILDDLGSSSMTDWQKEMLFQLVDIRLACTMPTLITSNLTFREINEKFHPRFASRLYAAKNTIIELKGHDRRKVLQQD